MSDSEQLVELITKAKMGNPNDLALLAQVVSHNLADCQLEKSQRLELMSLFRATAAQIADNDEYTRIYFDALVEVVRTYWCVLDDEVRKEADTEYLLENEERFGSILRALSGKEPKSLDDLKKELVNQQSSEEDLAQNLETLLGKSVVALLPGPGKYFVLSSFGEELVKKLSSKSP